MQGLLGARSQLHDNADREIIVPSFPSLGVCDRRGDDERKWVVEIERDKKKKKKHAPRYIPQDPTGQ